MGSASTTTLPGLFVTGATGFIGSHFIREAMRRGHRVVALRRTGSKSRIDLDQEPKWVDDGLGSTAHQAAFAGCDILVHLAAAGVSSKGDSWEECFHWNVDASIKEWLNASAAGIKRFIICGSCFEYGLSGERYDFIPPAAPLEPTGAYHASKAAATMAAFGLSVERHWTTVIARPFHVYGEGEAPGRLWPMIREASKTGTPLKLTLGEQIRDFTPVSLVVDELLRDCIRKDVVPGRPLVRNIGTGEPKTLRAFAEKCRAEFGGACTLEFGALQYRAGEVMRYVPRI